jgi:hypothetical protein
MPGCDPTFIVVDEVDIVQTGDTCLPSRVSECVVGKIWKLVRDVDPAVLLGQRKG